LNAGEDLAQTNAIGQVAIMQQQASARAVWINVKVADAPGVKGTTAAHNSMYFIAFRQQKLG